MKKILIAAVAALAFLGCAREERSVHAPWTYGSVVYEVNVRQYSPEHSFKGVEAQVPRLKDLGVDVLWLMPIYPIGVEERKGTLGSYYAVKDYCDVNPEFGTMQDFEDLLAATHAAGMRLILDWVPNHSAADHPWLTEKPADFYERDSLGNALYTADWNDTRNLNYANRAVWEAQDQALRFWLEKGVDGFRCDVASRVPNDYWEWVIGGIRRDYPEVYWLAESENYDQADPETTFDATYAWELHHLLNGIAQGKKGVQDLKDYIARDAENTPPTAFRLSFTSNHDENSWSGTEFERMGDAASVMAVLCFTLPKSQPLIYTGQEIGLDRRLQFFESDPVTDWSANGYTAFFQSLTALKHAHPALAAGEKGGPVEYLDAPEGVFAFSRAVKGDRVTVYANLSDGPVSVAGYELAPWGYEIVTE
ncbi:MAG: DUF3459 domain-containing protein [Bacteroidales bacterium]|nr:DUF3459 domain-containing protein [Bacteroidales bacterium]